MKFEDYIKQGKVFRVKKDILQAKGLINNSMEDFIQIKKYGINPDNASLTLKNTYDCIRAALHAFLSKEGYKPYSHEAIIQYAFENNLVNEEEANIINKFRILRNDIAYRAARATKEEAKRILNLAEIILQKLRNKLNEIN
jgi:uncharacterized protein (UPF0332 family)